MIKSQLNFAHATAALLLWQVQIFICDQTTLFQIPTQYIFRKCDVDLFNLLWNFPTEAQMEKV